MTSAAAGTLTVADLYQLAAAQGTEPELDQIMVAAALACSGGLATARAGRLANGMPTRFGLFLVNVRARTDLPYSVADLDEPAIQWAFMLPRFRRWWTTCRARGGRGAALAGEVAALALPPDGLATADARARYTASYRACYPTGYGDPEAAPPLVDRVFDAGAALIGLPYQSEPPPDGQTSCDAALLIERAVIDAGGAWPAAGARSAEAIRGACERAGSESLAPDAIQPGDLLFFDLWEPREPSQCADGRVLAHVGISYGAGSGRMLDCHAANGYRGAPGVGETDLRSDYWQAHLRDARRPWWLKEPHGE